jgi:hypothetical protein
VIDTRRRIGRPAPAGYELPKASQQFIWPVEYAVEMWSWFGSMAQ